MNAKWMVIPFFLLAATLGTVISPVVLNYFTIPDFSASEMQSATHSASIDLRAQAAQETTAASKTIAVGMPAPAFNLPATGGKNVSLEQFRGKNLIIVFYPMDQTQGCTIQLCALRDDYAKFKQANTAIIASNPASLKSHTAFVEKQRYPFPIVVDEKKSMAADYGVSGLGGFNKRTVFIVDKEGIVRFVEEGMPTNEELLDVIHMLNGSHVKTPKGA